MSHKIENKVITRSVEFRSASEELLSKRQVEFIISSESEDNHRTVFIQEGGDFSRFTPKGIVLYAHNSHSSNEDDVLGYGEIIRENDITVGRVTFEPKEINEKAEKIFRKIENGTPYMASIGFNPKKATFGDEKRNENPDVLYFREWELLEFSVVPIGSNPDANKRNAQTVADFRSAAENVDVSKQNENTKSVEEAQMIINKNRF